MKVYLLSWDKNLEDSLDGDQYSTLAGALRDAEDGQYVHEITARLHKVVRPEPTAVLVEYS